MRESEKRSRTAGASLLLFFESCQKLDLIWITSHLLPHWHCFRNRVLELALTWLPTLPRQTRQREICAHTRGGFFPCVLGRSWFLEPCSFLAFRFSEDCHPLPTFFATTSQLTLRGRVAVGSSMSKHAGPVTTRLFGRRESIQVIPGELLFFLLSTFAVSR